MSDRLILFIFLVVAFLIRRLPLKLVQRMGKLMGLFFFIFFHSEKKLLSTI